jgi:hypothetical protein
MTKMTLFNVTTSVREAVKAPPQEASKPQAQPQPQTAATPSPRLKIGQNHLRHKGALALVTKGGKRRPRLACPKVSPAAASISLRDTPNRGRSAPSRSRPGQLGIIII